MNYKITNEIKNSGGIDWEYEYDEIIFNAERLAQLLDSSKPIKKDDRRILQDAINLLLNYAKLK
jgi:hypothetical protein